MFGMRRMPRAGEHARRIPDKHFSPIAFGAFCRSFEYTAADARLDGAEIHRLFADRIGLERPPSGDIGSEQPEDLVRRLADRDMLDDRGYGERGWRAGHFGSSGLSAKSAKALRASRQSPSM